MNRSKLLKRNPKIEANESRTSLKSMICKVFSNTFSVICILNTCLYAKINDERMVVTDWFVSFFNNNGTQHSSQTELMVRLTMWLRQYDQRINRNNNDLKRYKQENKQKLVKNTTCWFIRMCV